MINFLQNLKIKNKLFVLLLIPLLGLLIFPANILYEKWGRINHSEQFAALTALSTNLNDLINKIQIERTMAVLIATQTVSAQEHQSNIKIFDDAIANTTTEHNKLNNYLIANNNILPIELVKKISKNLIDIQNLNTFRSIIKIKDLSFEEEITKYTNYIALLIAVQESTKGYNENAYNINLLDFSIILTKEQDRFGLIRGRISLALQNNDLTPDNKEKILALLNESTAYRRMLNFEINNDLARFKPLFTDSLVQKTDQIIDKTLKNTDPKSFKQYLNISQESWFSLATDRINLFYSASSEMQSMMQQAAKQSAYNNKVEFYTTLIFILTLLTVLTCFAAVCMNTLTRSVYALKNGATRIINKDYKSKVEVLSNDELGSLAKTFNEMLIDLDKYTTTNENDLWIKNGIAELRKIFQETLDVYGITNKSLTFMAEYLKCQVGLAYIVNKSGSYNLLASYAYDNRNHLLNNVDKGKSLVGQALLERKVICFNNPPDDYINITSGLGHAKPNNILISPLIYKNEVVGAIELGTAYEFNEIQKELLTEACSSIATALTFAFTRDRTNELLDETTRQAKELEHQQQELESNNEELKHQSVQLEETNQRLKEEKEKISKNNERLQIFQRELETKNNELESADKYKSEFLANMSHELRTPLNSLLIFAQLLSENKEKNLNKDQIEAAQIIHKSGKDLLTLINDILDLSKAEAGKLNANNTSVVLDTIIDNLSDNFNVVAKDKDIEFIIKKYDNLPNQIFSDSQRILQILRNLLANAFKFTEQGSVILQIKMIDNHNIQFNVIDTGIGIKDDKLQAIFDAFAQADGSITRKYGGTGLGLNISKKMALLLNGSLDVNSTLGKGSVFTLTIPINANQVINQTSTPEQSNNAQKPNAALNKQTPALNAKLSTEILHTVDDDTNNVTVNDKSILIIEDDKNFCKIVVDIIHGQGYKAITARNGHSGFMLAKKYLPCAIILDVNLPDINGISVLQMLKAEKITNNIPVHIISGIALEKNPFITQDAIGYLKKPASLDDITNTIYNIENCLKNQIKNILVVEDDSSNCKALEMLLSARNMRLTFAKNGKIAKELLIANRFDCVILDLTLPDTTGLELLNEISNDDNIKLPSLIVYTGKALSKDEYHELSKFTTSIVIKGDKSSERLLEELTLFLTNLYQENNLTNKKQTSSIPKDSNKKSKTILLVDDDMRNNLALSKVLSLEGIDILLADNGKVCLEQLSKHPEVNLVIMDIMMPEMDGYQAIECIRSQPQYKNLPIIALTANAMPGTKEKCLSVGASDYLTKPIEIDELLSLINLHLYDQRAAG